MKFIKKYNINDIGISGTTYLVRHIEDYLVGRNFEVAVKGDIIRFRRRVGFINIRGDLFRGVLLYVDIKDNDIIVKLEYFSFYKIAALFFGFCVPILLMLSPLITYPLPWILSFVFFILASVNGLYWLNGYLDLCRIFKQIDEVVKGLR